MNLDTLQHLLITYRYWILLPLAIVEGPVLALFVGILVKLNYLSFIPAYIVMICGDFIPDTFYYYAGRSGHNWKFLQKHLKKLNDQSLIIKMWHKHRIKTLFVSKLALGLAPALLVTAGVARVPYKSYIRWALFITILQYGFFILFGYYIGYSYDLVRDVKYFGFIIAGVVVVFLLVYNVVKRYARAKLSEMEHEVE